MLNRHRSQGLDAVRQTDSEERQLQSGLASTISLPRSPTAADQPDQQGTMSNQPTGQLQQSNLSTDSHKSRSLEGSISSRVDNRAASIYPGVLPIAISPKFRSIFVELNRLRSRFSHFTINLIHPDNREARPVFLQ